eukprot:c32428_g1_i1.p1 GENE.c32428_g1_i1~~c32428_g1_i1.p1  ORF type:complete len:451 (-),score=96.96 c32428_g1_i1:151-1503(-)
MPTQNNLSKTDLRGQWNLFVAFMFAIWGLQLLISLYVYRMLGRNFCKIQQLGSSVGLPAILRRNAVALTLRLNTLVCIMRIVLFVDPRGWKGYFPEIAFELMLRLGLVIILAEWLTIVLRWFELGELSGRAGLNVMMGNSRSNVFWFVLPVTVGCLICIVIVATAIDAHSPNTNADRAVNASIMIIALAFVIIGTFSGWRARQSLRLMMQLMASSRADVDECKKRKVQQILISLLIAVPCAIAAVVLAIYRGQQSDMSTNGFFNYLVIRYMIEIVLNGLTVYAVQNDPACLAPIMHSRSSDAMAAPTPKVSLREDRHKSLKAIQNHFLAEHDREFSAVHLEEMPWLEFFVFDPSEVSRPKQHLHQSKSAQITAKMKGAVGRRASSEYSLRTNPNGAAPPPTASSDDASSPETIHKRVRSFFGSPKSSPKRQHTRADSGLCRNPLPENNPV